MILAKNEISRLATLLDQATLEARERDRLTAVHPELSLEDAYLIQDEGIRSRYARGEKYRGLKMGFTSKAKMEQMGLHSPIYGVLTDRMEVRAGGIFSLKRGIHPKIEPEIAFLIGKRLRGKVSFEQALAGVSGITAAMEILDSRFVGFKYFSLSDVVADNCSSSYFVLGTEVLEPGALDVGDLAMTMKIDGKSAQSASSREILGHPVHSLMKLCEMLDSRGLSLEPGSVVLAGAATQAVPLSPGMHVELSVEKLGNVSIAVAAD